MCSNKPQLKAGELRQERGHSSCCELGHNRSGLFTGGCIVVAGSALCLPSHVAFGALLAGLLLRT